MNIATVIDSILLAKEDEEYAFKLLKYIAKARPDVFQDASEGLAESTKENEVADKLKSEATLLMGQGRRCDAIKRVRALTGWGLRTAIEYVDSGCSNSFYVAIEGNKR